MADKKLILSLICENCDSEFNLKFNRVTVSGVPHFCPFCSEPIESGIEDNDDDEERSYEEE